MKLPRPPHRWRLEPRQAVALQRELAAQVVLRPLARTACRVVVGLDCAFIDDEVLAVGVVWEVAGRRVLETRAARARIPFPYVPGLLSFRELPVLMKVLRRLATPVGAVLCDGQGIAHPRRCGIASHLGVITGLPAIGCAKSRLYGSHESVELQRGASVPLVAEDGSGDELGRVLCTRDGVKPLYVSPGHLADNATAQRLVLDCSGGFRLPEPTRQADRLVAQYKRAGYFRGGVVASARRDLK